MDKRGNATVVLTSKDEKGKNRRIRCNLNNKGDIGYNYVSHAYCLTQVKSQGATFEKSIINHSSEFQTNYNGMYVSITRAKNDVSIYTNDKKRMINQALEEQPTPSTLDFIKPKHQEKKVVEPKQPTEEKKPKPTLEQLCEAERISLPSLSLNKNIKVVDFDTLEKERIEKQKEKEPQPVKKKIIRKIRKSKDIGRDLDTGMDMDF